MFNFIVKFNLFVLFFAFLLSTNETEPHIKKAKKSLLK